MDTLAMDTIEYHCPIHGLVESRSGENHGRTPDLWTCPVQGHPDELPCGRHLFVEFSGSPRIAGR